MRFIEQLWVSHTEKSQPIRSLILCQGTHTLTVKDSKESTSTDKRRTFRDHLVGKTLPLMVHPLPGLHGIAICPFLDGRLWIRWGLIIRPAMVDDLFWRWSSWWPERFHSNRRVKRRTQPTAENPPTALQAVQWHNADANSRIFEVLKSQKNIRWDLISCERITQWICVLLLRLFDACCLRNAQSAEKEMNSRQTAVYGYKSAGQLCYSCSTTAGVTRSKHQRNEPVAYCICELIHLPNRNTSHETWFLLVLEHTLTSLTSTGRFHNDTGD